MSAGPVAPDDRRRDALWQVETLFAEAALSEPAADARILMEEATGLRRFALLADGDHPLGATAAERLNAWVPRRLAREPVFRILGRREFWGLTLRVTPDVLDPRPDTETAVEAAVRALASRSAQPLRVLDLGTGSGAILCALLSEWRAARGVGIDRSPAACAVARGNLQACGLADRADVFEGDWTDGVEGRFDCIASNPPYVPRDVLATLDPEVRAFDPLAALDGGHDGLGAYRAICPRLPGLLAPGGVVVFEVGTGQAAEVATLLVAAGLQMLGISRDLGGHERAVLAGPSPSQSSGSARAPAMRRRTG